jgi:hypothetical protein
LLAMIHRDNALPKASRAPRVAKQQQCFSPTGALDRIENHSRLWSEALKLPGSEESWLTVLPSGNFQCKCCSFRGYGQKHSRWHKDKGLASAEGLQPTQWTRLQTFRQHETKHHELNAALYVRAMMPEVPAAGFASPSHDFLDLLKAVKARKVKNEEKYAKRKKMRAMTYCLAEAIRRMKLPILVKAKQAALMHDGADDKLYCRFTVCTPEHTRVTGFLGVDNTVQKHHTADSLALANSLKSIVEGACTT